MAKQLRNFAPEPAAGGRRHFATWSLLYHCRAAQDVVDQFQVLAGDGLGHFATLQLGHFRLEPRQNIFRLQDGVGLFAAIDVVDSCGDERRAPIPALQALGVSAIERRQLAQRQPAGLFAAQAEIQPGARVEI